MASSSDPIAGLYADHHGWLQGWLRKKLGCTHQAADLAHDTFIRMLTAFGQKQGAVLDLKEPRAYLTTVASRILINHYRRQSLEYAYLNALALMPEAVAPSPEQRALILETLNEIDAMLDGLPIKARRAFLLAQLDGLGYAEIADQLGTSTRTVRRYMAMAYEQCLLLEI